ncbi:MAG: hypothetical protein KDA68_17910 [Planctomycetaceae bacterium]|nr:hypothetical protein [Planctomycetaceae bacterium]
MSKAGTDQKPPRNPHRRSFLGSLVAGILAFTGIPNADARGPKGRGMRGRGGAGGGPGQSDPTMQVDQATIRTLLSNRNQIRRQVKLLPNGVETITETDNPQLRAVLVQHVLSMKLRVEQTRPIHLRDALFAALFRNANKIAMRVAPTSKGVHVIETSNDPLTVKLIQAHASVVSLFIKNGPIEVRKNHLVP